MQEKRCNHCGEVKPISEFGKDRRNKDGLNGYCKVCKKTFNEEYRRKRGVSPRVNENTRTHCEYMREYRKSNIKARNYDKKYAHDYRVKHPEFSKKTSANHRARVFNCEGSITETEIVECVNFFEHKCAYSGEPLNDDYQLDHVVPLSKGGENTIYNIVPCLAGLNLEKSNYDFEEWYGNHATFNEGRHNKIKEWTRKRGR